MGNAPKSIPNGTGDEADGDGMEEEVEGSAVEPPPLPIGVDEKDDQVWRNGGGGGGREKGRAGAPPEASAVSVCCSKVSFFLGLEGDVSASLGGVGVAFRGALHCLAAARGGVRTDISPTASSSSVFWRPIREGRVATEEGRGDATLGGGGGGGTEEGPAWETGEAVESGGAAEAVGSEGKERRETGGGGVVEDGREGRRPASSALPGGLGKKDAVTAAKGCSGGVGNGEEGETGEAEEEEEEEDEDDDGEEGK